MGFRVTGIQVYDGRLCQTKKNTIMKRSEILEHLSQYKAEINRKLKNTGSKKQIGYTLVNGKSPSLYVVHEDQTVHNFVIANSGNDLLQKISVVHSTIQVFFYNEGMKTVTYILPAYWASALVNADNSGLSDDDEKELNAWHEKALKKHGSLHCTCPDGEPYFSSRNDAGTLAGDVLKYTFIVQQYSPLEQMFEDEDKVLKNAQDFDDELFQK